MEHFVSSLAAYLPVNVDFLSMLKFVGIFAFAALFVGLLSRVIIGKRSGVNQAVSTAMGILCVYVVSVVIYTFDPYDLAKYLSPLPFVTFQAETLRLFRFQGAELSVICTEVLSMIILAFLYNLLDSFIPKGKKVLGWYAWRFFTVALAIAAHYGITWAFNTYLPGALAAYAPMILLAILASMMLLGLLNVILSVILTVVNPIIGALYAFFFSSKVGTQVSKAVVTTGILMGFVYALDYLGYGLIGISAAALAAYLPMLLILLGLWYIIGHLL